jgi:uncharacterized membrane protein YgcG
MMMTPPPLLRACQLFLLILCWSGAVPAEEILDYKVDLVGAADGTLMVEERIDYDFGNLQRHGIYRDIPNRVPAPWGGQRTLEIGEIEIQRDRQAARFAEESVHGDAGPMLRLRIGDPDRTISGRHLYTIRYQVDDSLLPAGDRDAFRWNAIGTGWNVPIESAQIRLKLPAELHGHPDLKARFFTGRWGSTARNGHTRWSQEEGIFAVTAGPLAPHEGVTVEASFPAGAISATAHPSSAATFWQALPHLWAWALLLGGLGLAWRHWYRVGRDPATGPVAVRYQPPKGLEAAEAGLLLDQSLDKADLTGAVIELARDGWLKIERPEERGGILKLLKRDRVTLERLHHREDWSQLPPYKRYLLESFFCRGDRFSPGGEESASVVRERNKWLGKAKARIHERGVEHGLFPENPKKVRIKYGAGAAILGLLLLVAAFTRSPMAPEVKFPLVFVLGFVSIFAFTTFRRFRERRTAILPLLFFLAAGLFLLYQILPIVWSQLTMSLPGWGTVLLDPLVPIVILVAGLLIFAWQMPRRTNNGAQARRELLGFKKFMQRAEAPRLRAMLEQDPEYFEHTLPFAALFGLVAEWSSRFEGLVAMPVWYEGGSLDHLGHDLSHLSSSGVTSSPPASSGGSSGGGGFSGGGGGGGGGGSW